MNPPPDRWPHLDGLRVAALALLIPYHVGMYYVSWDWHVKSPAAGPTLQPFMLLTAPWRLALLFFVAGAAASVLAQRRRLGGFIGERSRRLLLPLLFGMAVIVPPQAYFEVLTRVPEQLPGDGGYLAFWAAYLGGGRYCQGTDCMLVPTWNHLWFLPYLWCYAVVGVLLAKRLPPRRPIVGQAWHWLLLPAAVLIALRLGVAPFFPSTHDLLHDLYNHLLYGSLFALGWASCGALAGFWPVALRTRWLTLVLALASWALWVGWAVAYRGAEWPPELIVAQRVLWALQGWWALMAACGWTQRAFTRDTPALRAAAAGVFCVYVLHQTVIVLLTRLLLPFQLPWGLEALLLLAATVALSVGAYRVLRRVPVLRGLVGIRAPTARGP